MLYVKYCTDDDFEIKSKIYSLNCLSCFYSYFELQDDFILRILFLSDLNGVKLFNAERKYTSSKETVS